VSACNRNAPRPDRQKIIREHEVGLRAALILLIAGFILLGSIAHADVLKLFRGIPF
jgi:hypothetical protein